MHAADEMGYAIMLAEATTMAVEVRDALLTGLHRVNKQYEDGAVTTAVQQLKH